jgi:hypothetical protein
MGNIKSAADWTANTWISTVSAAQLLTRGKNGVSMKDTPPSQAIRVGPRLVDFFLDMTTYQLVLLFSVPVNKARFDSSGVGIYSRLTSSSVYLSPGYAIHGYFASSPNVDFIETLTLSAYDINRIKGIDVRMQQVFVISKPDFTFDINGTGSSPVFESNLMPSSRFNSYTTPPVLLNMTLNMADNYLLMVFDEPIRLSAVVLQNFRLQAYQSSFNISYKLTSADMSFSNEVLKVKLSLADSSEIKLTNILAKSSATSFFSCTFKTILDMADNKMQPIATNNARKFDVYIPDSKRPFLVSFDVNMDAETITFHFSEPVVAVSFDVTKIFTQSKFYRDQVCKLLLFCIFASLYN